MAFTEKDRDRIIKQGELLATIHTQVVDQLLPVSRDHEARIRSMEKTHLKALGAATVISALIGYVMPWLKGS